MSMEFKDLKKLLKNDASAFPEIKIAVLADSASQLLAIALKGYGVKEGFNFRIWEAEYDSIFQTTLDAEGELYQMKPDHVILFMSTKKLQQKFYKKEFSAQQDFATENLEMITRITGNIKQHISCNFIVMNFPEINDSIFGNFANKTPYSFLYQLRKINTGLMDMAIENKTVNICDLSSLQNSYGSNAFFSDKLYINTTNVLDIDVLPAVAKHVTDIILAYSGRFKKSVILDLDNTLWGGIIGDDGLEGIQIGELGIGKAFSELQNWIIQLKNRGIIIAVCSKNTEHVATDAFENHPDMVLKLSDIAMFVANWKNKADNIRQIQAALNIGFDSMVFIDDNPAERDIVKRELPMVTVPDLPEDPAEYVSFLASQNLFETVSFTEADGKRNDQYREEAKRAVLQQSFTDEAGFLKSLEMTAEVKPVNSFTLPRASQLTQRSNQFNLRTVRYSEEQMKKIIAEEGKFTYTISIKDKFGDYGLISLLVLEKKPDAVLFIDTWIMSCRVLKRNVEDFTLNRLILLAEELGCSVIEGEYIPTSKNGIVKEHYSGLGFRETGAGFWQLDVQGYGSRKTFITLN